jgi:hypothetical protein
MAALRPLLRPVQNADNLDRFLSYAINNQERETGDHHLSRVGLTAFSSTLRHLFQRVRAFVDSQPNTPGLGGSKTFLGIAADMPQIIRGGLRPANEH